MTIEDDNEDNEGNAMKTMVTKMTMNDNDEKVGNG